MRVYHFQATDGQLHRWADRWRGRWALSVVFPLLPLLGIALFELTTQAAWLWLPLAVIYGLVPLLDWRVGTDTSNPPEAVVAELERDPFYRWLTYAAAPVHLGVMIGGFWYALTLAEGPWQVLPLVLALGFMAALAINTGHELGHKGHEPDRTLALLNMALSGYGHFRVEHNLGHHAAVATPEDTASARMGESLYRFARREMSGGMRRGWQIEVARLRRAGRSAWSPGNEILQAHAMTLLLQGGLLAWLGWQALPWLALHNAWAWLQVTGVNYIEHYGLLRRQRADGSYERCLARHSWNSNHAVSNVLLFHLQRHSDHHAHAERHYQSLRHVDEAPQLPTGYMGMLLLAWVPPLFFRVMDPRLLRQAGGDLSRVNLDPSRRDQYLPPLR